MLTLTPSLGRTRAHRIAASRALGAQRLRQVLCWSRAGDLFLGDPRQGLGTGLGGRVSLGWELRHPAAHGGAVVQGLLCSLGRPLPPGHTHRAAEDLRAGRCGGQTAPACTCGGGDAKIISAKEHVLRRVSSSPGPLFPQQLRGGWAGAKDPWEPQGQAGLCVGLCKEPAESFGPARVGTPALETPGADGAGVGQPLSSAARGMPELSASWPRLVGAWTAEGKGAGSPPSHHGQRRSSPSPATLEQARGHLRGWHRCQPCAHRPAVCCLPTACLFS